MMLVDPVVPRPKCMVNYLDPLSLKMRQIDCENVAIAAMFCVNCSALQGHICAEHLASFDLQPGTNPDVKSWRTLCCGVSYENQKDGLVTVLL